jgi:hypothetical protein
LLEITRAQVIHNIHILPSPRFSVSQGVYH